MHERQAAIYIMANKRNGTLYVGVTRNLKNRVYQHKFAEGSKFTKRYQCKLLVYYEFFDNIYDAISREKQIKNSNQKKKLSLIESINPEWEDLYELFYY